MNDTYAANYLFRDYVTNDVSCFNVGEVSLYFYKETLIGARKQKIAQSLFLELPLTDDKSMFSPAVDEITVADIDEAINEVHEDASVRRYTHSIIEIQEQAKSWLAEELRYPSTETTPLPPPVVIP